MSNITPIGYSRYQGDEILQPLIGELSQLHKSISPALPKSYKNILPDAKTIARKLQAFNLNSGDEAADGNE